MDQRLVYTRDIAQLLGITEAAVRSHLQRRAWPNAIPAPFRLGRKWAWRLQDIDRWFAEKTRETVAREVGRPRKTARI